MDTMTQTGIEELTDYGELEGLLPPEKIPAPEASRCFVWRDEDGSIGGFCFAQVIPVVEPIWVHPKHRGRFVAPKLFGAAVGALQQGDAKAIYAHSGDPDVIGYLTRLNWKPFGNAFSLDLSGGA